MIGSTPPGTWMEPTGYPASTMFDRSEPAPKGCSALLPLQRAAGVPEADPVGDRCQGPGGLQQCLQALLGQPVVVEPEDDAQVDLLAERRGATPREPTGPGCPARRRRQHVAGLEHAALVAAEGAQRVRRAAAEHLGDVDAAGDRDVDARPGLEEAERHDVAGPRRRSDSHSGTAAPVEQHVHPVPRSPRRRRLGEPQLGAMYAASMTAAPGSLPTRRLAAAAEYWSTAPEGGMPTS